MLRLKALSGTSGPSRFITLIFQKSRNLPIATLVEEMKAVVTDKDDFECRDKTDSIFWSFRTIKILMQEKSR